MAPRSGALKIGRWIGLLGPIVKGMMMLSRDGQSWVATPRQVEDGDLVVRFIPEGSRLTGQIQGRIDDFLSKLVGPRKTASVEGTPAAAPAAFEGGMVTEHPFFVGRLSGKVRFTYGGKSVTCSDVSLILLQPPAQAGP